MMMILEYPQTKFNSQKMKKVLSFYLLVKSILRTEFLTSETQKLRINVLCVNSQKFEIIQQLIKTNKTKMNWKLEEDNMIRWLRNQEKMSSWIKIAERLNFYFPQSQRNGKQCRERYFNTARFSEECQEEKTWSIEEDELLCNLYIENGSKWTFFMKHFPNKSQNTIKNRFYCCLRKATRKLKEGEGKYSSVGKRIIKNQMLLAILQLTNRVEKQAMEISDIEINFSWSIFKLRKNLLDLAFKRKDFQKQQLKEISKQIHKMNYRFKCLGITKMKIKSKWDLTQKRLSYILGFEQDFISSQMTTDQHAFSQQDKNTSTVQNSEKSLIQKQVKSSNEDNNFQKLDEKEYIYTHPLNCYEFLEKQFCEIIGIQYIPMFPGLHAFY